jgi:hypothetical protein
MQKAQRGKLSQPKGTMQHLYGETEDNCGFLAVRLKKASAPRGTTGNALEVRTGYLVHGRSVPASKLSDDATTGCIPTPALSVLASISESGAVCSSLASAQTG